MTKAQICKSISQNFIVRNNIIAAILTLVPKVEFNGNNYEYTGGLAFQKFLNLENCGFCISREFDNKNLSKMSIEEEIYLLLKTSDIVEQKDCETKNKNLYFKKLDSDQKKYFTEVALGTEPKNDMVSDKQRKYNKTYFKFVKELKNSYFTTLIKLIDILQAIKDKPFISNEDLNTISLNTKNLINTLYNKVNRLYIGAIMNLLEGKYRRPKTNDLNRNKKIQGYFNN